MAATLKYTNKRPSPGAAHAELFLKFALLFVLLWIGPWLAF
jgi:hypothetical protein